MTPPAPNYFLFNDEFYHIIDLEYFNRLYHFTKQIHAYVQSKGPAIFRGWVAYFTIQDNRLILEALKINLKPGTNKIPELNGVTPTDEPHKRYWKQLGMQKPFDNPEDRWTMYYENINLKINYTGKILIGIAIGYGGKPKYELYFENGKLISSEKIESKKAN